MVDSAEAKEHVRNVVTKFKTRACSRLAERIGERQANKGDLRLLVEV